MYIHFSLYTIQKMLPQYARDEKPPIAPPLVRLVSRAPLLGHWLLAIFHCVDYGLGRLDLGE